MVASRVLVGLAVASAVTFLGACNKKAGEQAQTAPNEFDKPGAAEAPVETKAIILKARAFAPITAKVAVGSTVTWTNQDALAHTVTGGAPQRGVARPGGLAEVSLEDGLKGAFDQQLSKQGDTFEFKLDQPGTYQYFCKNHAGMDGRLIVE